MGGWTTSIVVPLLFMPNDCRRGTAVSRLSPIQHSPLRIPRGYAL